EQQRRARRRVLLGGVMRFVQEGAKLRLGREKRRRTGDDGLEDHDAGGKIGATTTPTPASSTTLRSAGSCAVQPVVPTTRLMPRRASTGRLVTIDSAIEKSIATSTPFQQAASAPPPWRGETGSITPATSHPYCGASSPTS